jgi:hypothetical protein
MAIGTLLGHFRRRQRSHLKEARGNHFELLCYDLKAFISSCINYAINITIISPRVYVSYQCNSWQRDSNYIHYLLNGKNENALYIDSNLIYTGALEGSNIMKQF